MEKPNFTRENLSDVRVILVIIHVPVEELLCQVVMGWISVLECLLSGARGCLWLMSVMLGIKWHCITRTQLQGCSPNTGEPQSSLPRAWVCAELRHEGNADWADRW
jgi:hypothetical protein